MKKTVLVTGGTGYVAAWVVKELLDGGHDVRITVRDAAKTEKYQHLLDVEQQSSGKLTVYEADLLEKGSFDEAVKGTEYVFHTASPFFRALTSPRKLLRLIIALLERIRPRVCTHSISALLCGR